MTSIKNGLGAAFVGTVLVASAVLGDPSSAYGATKRVETYSLFDTPKQGECVIQKALGENRALIWCESGLERYVKPGVNVKRNGYQINADTITVKFRGRTYTTTRY